MIVGRDFEGKHLSHDRVKHGAVFGQAAYPEDTTRSLDGSGIELRKSEKEFPNFQPVSRQFFPGAYLAEHVLKFPFRAEILSLEAERHLFRL